MRRRDRRARARAAGRRRRVRARRRRGSAPRTSRASRRRSARAAGADSRPAPPRRSARARRPARGSRGHFARDHCGPADRRRRLCARACRTSVSSRSVSACEHRLAGRRQPVVPPPLVVFGRRGAPAVGLFDQRERFEPGERGVERAGAEADAPPVRSATSRMMRVAVQMAVGQRQQDVELLRRQRQETAGVVHGCIVAGCIELRRSCRRMVGAGV